MCQVCIALPNVICLPQKVRCAYTLPLFIFLSLNISILSSPPLLSHCRERFLDKGRPKGKRPLSTETAVLLHGGRPNHAFWRNQVRHDAYSIHVYCFCDTHHFNSQFDSQFTPHVGALLLSVPTLTLKVSVLQNCDLSPHCRSF